MIDEREANAIRKLFEPYATDQYSMKQIEQILYNDGFRNRHGNKLSHATTAHIIRNPKYKGYFCGNKVTVEDMSSKKMVFILILVKMAQFAHRLFHPDFASFRSTYLQYASLHSASSERKN